MKKPSIAILGAGSWGTAVAIHLAHAGHPVLLWGHQSSHVQQMVKDQCNQRYLPNIAFPKGLLPTDDLRHALEADFIIVAVPSHAFASLLDKIHHPIPHIAWLTKGIDPATHQLLSQLVANKWGVNFPMTVISGPSFAKEVAQQLPTALVLASNNHGHQQALQNLLHHHHVRVYLSDDMPGVQLAGAVKNILAIACGISDGLQYGANAKAALITRGLAEMSRLGQALGARAETFMGLAGVGDLVLTCTDNQSRNRRFGLLLGQGMSQQEAEKQIGQVVEGKYNALHVCALSHAYHVDMPICNEVNALLQNQTNVRAAVINLMQRPPKNETW